ncbi:hypothetical protein D3C79_899550 [compost metagenome]
MGSGVAEQPANASRHRLISPCLNIRVLMFKLLLFGQQFGVSLAHGLMPLGGLKLGFSLIEERDRQLLARRLFTYQGGTGGLQGQPLHREILLQAIHSFGLLALQQPALGHLADRGDGHPRQ